MNLGYFAAAVAIAASITFALRLLPVLFRQRLGQAKVLEVRNSWLPLGAMVALAGYGIVATPLYQLDRAALPYAAALVVTVVLHAWRRHIFLSLSCGTLTCVLLSLLLL